MPPPLIRPGKILSMYGVVTWGPRNLCLLHSFSGDEDDVQAWLRAFPKAHFGLGKKCPAAPVVGLPPVDQLVLERDAPFQCDGPADLAAVSGSPCSMPSVHSNGGDGDVLGHFHVLCQDK